MLNGNGRGVDLSKWGKRRIIRRFELTSLTEVKSLYSDEGPQLKNASVIPFTILAVYNPSQAFSVSLKIFFWRGKMRCYKSQRFHMLHAIIAVCLLSC